jgi:hypothetical protein
MAFSPSGLWPSLGLVTRANTPLFLHRQSTIFGAIRSLETDILSRDER